MEMFQDIGSQMLQCLYVAACGEVLKCADTHVGRGHPCQNSAFKYGLAKNRLFVGHNAQCTRRWQAKCGESLAENILA
ncbi:hypothetical protein D9M70_607580 [compost metagenome]